MQRGGALIDGGEALDEPLPRPRRHAPASGRSICSPSSGALVARDLAAAGGALLAGTGGVLAGGRGGLAGGGSDLTGAERLGLGAVRLALGDLELAAEAGDQLAQLLGVGAAGLLRALGERDGLVDRRAQRADVREDGAGAAIDLRDALERVLAAASACWATPPSSGDDAERPFRRSQRAAISSRPARPSRRSRSPLRSSWLARPASSSRPARPSRRSRSPRGRRGVAETGELVAAGQAVEALVERVAADEAVHALG